MDDEASVQKESMERLSRILREDEEKRRNGQKVYSVEETVSMMRKVVKEISDKKSHCQIDGNNNEEAVSSCPGRKSSL